MKTGHKYVVYVYLDETTDRVVATTRFNKFLSDETPDLSEGQEVDLVIYKQTPLGFKAIINNTYKGMIFENEIFQALSIGDQIKGYVKQVRPDGKVDLILQKTGLDHIDPLTTKILDYLKSQKGSMEITDKSPAELIYARFGVSKRAFKQAIGKLYKKRIIKIEGKQISLINS
jgi:predicted RNA-binding protein (virulence factor B family)